MKKLTILLPILILFFVTSAMAMDIAKITKTQLKEELGSKDLVILDVRAGNKWTSSKYKIEGAVRVSPKHLNTWINKYDKEKKYVLYCT